MGVEAGAGSSDFPFFYFPAPVKQPSSIQDVIQKNHLRRECLLVRTAVCCLALGRSRYNTNTARHTRRRGSSRDTGNGVSRYYGTVRSVEKCKLGWYEYVYF